MTLSCYKVRQTALCVRAQGGSLASVLLLSNEERVFDLGLHGNEYTKYSQHNSSGSHCIQNATLASCWSSRKRNGVFLTTCPNGDFSCFWSKWEPDCCLANTKCTVRHWKHSYGHWETPLTSHFFSNKLFALSGTHLDPIHNQILT